MSGCDTLDSFRYTFIDKAGEDSNENVIYVGVFEPQTGRNAEKGAIETRGIELANSIYNSVNGYKVSLVKVDTQSSTSAAETAIQGLIDMHPVVIIGSAGEATSLVASKYIKEAEIPTITPTATNPLITQNCDYYFRASMTSSQIGAGVADYIYTNLGSRHIGIITGANDTAAAAYTEGFNDKIKDFLKKEKDDEEDDDDDDEDSDDEDKKKEKSPVVLTADTTLEDESIADIIKSIEKKKVDTLFVPLGTEAMDKFFTAIEDSGHTDIKFIGIRDWGNEDFIKMMENHPGISIAFPYDSVLGTTGASDNLSEEAERFCIEYANKYGADDMPTAEAALGYDAYLLMINAIHNAGSIEGPEIRKALLELKDVKCATGVFNFDEKGNTVRPVNISTIKDGKVVSVKITKEDTEAKDLEGVKE